MLSQNNAAGAISNNVYTIDGVKYTTIQSASDAGRAGSVAMLKAAAASSIQSALSSSGDVEIPCGTYNLTAGLTIATGNRRVYGHGDCTVLSFAGSSLTAVDITGANVDISQLKIEGNTAGTLCFGVVADTGSAGSKIHDITFDYAGTCSPTATNSAVRILDSNVEVLRNKIRNGGPAGTGNAWGYGISASTVSNASIHDNILYSDNNYTQNIANFNCGSCTVASNFIDGGNAYNGSHLSNTGYGIESYGVGTGNIAASPTGLVRTGGTANTPGTLAVTFTAHHPFSVGEQIYMQGPSSVGGTDFSGSCTVLTVSQRSLTCSQVGANDAGGGGIAIHADSGCSIHDNIVQNVTGFGTYLESQTDCKVYSNTYTNTSSRQSGGSLNTGSIALVDVDRSSVTNNKIINSNRSGITFANGHKTLIGHNTITGTPTGTSCQSGIYCSGVYLVNGLEYENSILNNTIIGGGYGIFATHVSGTATQGTKNNITGNTIDGVSKDGIHEAGIRNQVQGNTVSNSQGWGMNFSGSSLSSHMNNTLKGNNAGGTAGNIQNAASTIIGGDVVEGAATKRK